MTQPIAHKRTFAKIPRTNRWSINAAVVLSLAVIILGAVVKGLDSGQLAVPPDIRPYVPWVVIIGSAILTAFGVTAAPSFHPGLSADQSHVPPPPRPPSNLKPRPRPKPRASNVPNANHGEVS